MALVVAQEVPTSSIMAVPHGPTGVGMARRRMRAELLASGVQDTVVDDAVLILSELLSNSCRHARPIHENDSPHSVRGPARDTPPESVRASWRIDTQGRLMVSVTDGGGPTRPLPATPSVTAHGGRGLAIIRSLAKDWGVRDTAAGEVTVWAVLSLQGAFATRVDLATELAGDLTDGLTGELPGELPSSLGAERLPGLPPGLAFADFDDPA
ncbi:ATP-binding protein [Streptomyces halobius]|uniref:ATP-binding protein n=1 Tax=Streptomyces halobius TaxID=2879846 RepID=A0ABY4MCZ9_9ACTN|nr:ATP-binding protein [Streptomyces halobius]UQA94196.1 ATP-binding protein [Streptomyces halobius]